MSGTPTNSKMLPEVKGLGFRRGKMTPEMIAAVEEKYRLRGWERDPEGIMLSFVSPCGRWFECYDRETSQLYCIDGEWIVNLRVSKKEG